jgi:hypothetical protein
MAEITERLPDVAPADIEAVLGRLSPTTDGELGWLASRAQIRLFLGSIPKEERAPTLRILRAIFDAAVDLRFIESSPMPVLDTSEADAILARNKEASALLVAMSRGRKPATALAYRRVIARFVAWCERNNADPVRITTTIFERYLADAERSGIEIYSSKSPLRRFFDEAIEFGVRESHPLPRWGVAGVAGTKDPLAPLVARVVRRYSKLTRASVLSLISRHIERAREAGYEPLNMTPDAFDRLFPDDDERKRAWGALAALSDLAAKRGVLDPRGEDLRRHLVNSTPTGLRRLSYRWRAWTKEHGYKNPGVVPLLRREAFLSSLLSEGASPADVAAMRISIVDMERQAKIDGLRPHRPARIERLLARLALLGLTEPQAQIVIDHLHVGLSMQGSVHRSVDSIVMRWLNFCSAISIEPNEADEENVNAFFLATFGKDAAGHPKRGHLGMMPLRRLAGGLVAVGRRAPRAEIFGNLDNLPKPAPADESAPKPAVADQAVEWAAG